MSERRVLVLDGYHVVKLLREFDISFEDVASLGCYIEGEPATKLRPGLIAEWYGKETGERESKDRVPDEL